MYLSRLRLNRGRTAVSWAANPYRVHQRLTMACEGDARVLFRIEDTPEQIQVIVQSHGEPHWESAFKDLAVLAGPAEQKPFEPRLVAGRRYRFRLMANPTVKKKDEQGKPVRLGLMREEEQRSWLARKLTAAGATLIGCTAAARGLQRSRKGAAQSGMQTHFAVLFEGVLQVEDPVRLRRVLGTGIGSAKGYGFGLLSLAAA